MSLILLKIAGGGGGSNHSCKTMEPLLPEESFQPYVDLESWHRLKRNNIIKIVGKKSTKMNFNAIKSGFF